MSSFREKVKISLQKGQMGSSDNNASNILQNSILIQNSLQGYDMPALVKQLLIASKNQQNFIEKIVKTFEQNQIEPRDRILTIPLPQQKGETLEKQVLEEYITLLCKNVWSRAFFYFYNNQISYENVKIYSSYQILQSIVRLSQKFKLKAIHFQIINSHIQDKVLDYMLNKYPQTLSQDVNRNVHNTIKDVNHTNLLVNDYLYNSSVVFKYRENGEYNDCIMKSLNEVLNKIGNKIKNKTIFEKFEEKLQKLFESVLDEDWMKFKEEEDKQKSDNTEKNQLVEDFQSYNKLFPISSNPGLNHKCSREEESQLKKELMKQRQKEKEKYRNKVKEYTEYKICKKLPDSTRRFTQEEIKSHSIKIESPQVLRVMTKWCEQLERKFSIPNYFQQFIECVKLENGKSMAFGLEEMKQKLDLLISQERERIKNSVRQLIKNNYYMQSQLLVRQLMISSTQIEHYERISATYSIDIVNNLHSYIILYLNRLIHGLLIVSNKFSRYLSQKFIDIPSHINLIEFRICDLIRCRFSSGQKQVLRIFRELVKICQGSSMSLVRIVNRLKKGTHDVVINVKYKQVLCQIQLRIVNTKNSFIEFSNIFNHYLYELKRSFFGPLTQLCNIWKSLDSRFNFYVTLQPVLSKNREKPNSHIHNQYEIYSKPFICNKCGIHTYHNNFIKQHLKCKLCKFWLCAQCQIEISDCKTVLKAAYKNEEIIQKCVRVKCKQTEIPNYGICVYKQRQQIKVQPFKKYTSKSTSKIIGSKNKSVYQIFDISSQQKQNKFKQKYLIYQLGQTPKKYIRIDQDKIKQFLMSQKIKTIYANHKEKICLNHLNITNQLLNKLASIGSPADKYNIRKIQIIGNQIQSIGHLSKEFQNICCLEISQNNMTDFVGLMNFPRLQKLNINENKIAIFPSEICSLQSLKELSLCQNGFKILPSQFSNLKQLKRLKLSNNKFQEFPICISDLVQLSELYMKSNFIKEIPCIVGSLNQIQILELQNNYIKNIDSNISKLKKLQNLNLSHNQISDLPDSFFNLHNLSRCNLRNNQLQNIPASINYLQNLTYLDLSNNKIVVCPNINLANIVQINLNSNFIEHLPQFGKVCVNLRKIPACHNNLKSFPSLQNVINLQELYLNNNKISQILPSTLTKLQNLQILQIQQNLLSEFNEIQLQKLKILKLSSNKLIQFNNNDLTYAEDIDISNNSITSFSSNMMPFIKKLNLNHNSLESIDLRNYPKLKMGFCQLESFEQNHIKSMSLENNQIKSIANQLSSAKSLTQINLAHNFISVLPKQLQKLSNLEDKCLQISNNPIEQIECWQFLMKKGSIKTLTEISLSKKDFTAKYLLMKQNQSENENSQ